MAKKPDRFERRECPVMDLELDPENPRIRLRDHGDERARIESLSMPDGKHLRVLCEDIAENGLGPDPIVIEETEGRQIVRDGNRRVASLKMLLSPEVAPTSIRERVYRAAENALFAPEVLECHVSAAPGVVRDYMRRKHTGEGEGEGLRAWDAVERAFWEADYGFPTQHKRAVQLLRYAEDLGIHKTTPEFPVTTLTRILSDEWIDELGIEGLSEGNPKMTQSEPLVCARIRKIVEDIRDKRVIVSENAGPGQASVYTDAGRRAYVAEVMDVGPESGSDTDSSAEAENEGEGTTDGAGTGSNQQGSDGPGADGAPSQNATNHGGRPPQEPWRRRHVAAPAKSNGVQNLPNHARKARALMAELREINVERFPNACAVTVRMFIEVSVDEYLSRKDISCKKNDLRERLKKAVNHMVQEGIFDEKEGGFYKQQAAREQISVETLHAIVHSGQFVGDRQTINTFWDNLLSFVRHCWHS